MPTSYGTLQWVAPNRANAKFDIDGVDTTCAMTINGAVPNFGSSEATLNFQDTDQLSGTRSFDGHIGRGDFETDFDNAPKIQGDLSMPIDQYITVMGNAIWTRSF
ncbi:hypothetical protein AtubIFM54640_005066 [Aspergillus tubingensis]|jgi:hypothetical protein|uniref:Uncharacterized protein n=1 Tax=Aspergillus niger TaxID=5061 RepID=A0A100I7I8_ASPNG|nr:amino acid adenylation domain protein [Aspergillus tubingensis]GAQ36144.1 hypothetical protein AKAW_04771 [Aspergillus niger]GFN14341.1 amino acid adenylation domain protein [Aspergillus tubingensis]GLA63905.1 hypothetical protein AtubIFM54640_005066 [Aspergillus tubingensis]GLB12999.1 hypothetical protein AtubIFM61612_000394 [Aspergillus tubingensis]